MCALGGKEKVDPTLRWGQPSCVNGAISLREKADGSGCIVRSIYLYSSENLRAPVASFTCDQALDRSAFERSARVAKTLIAT